MRKQIMMVEVKVPAMNVWQAEDKLVKRLKGYSFKFIRKEIQCCPAKNI